MLYDNRQQIETIWLRFHNIYAVSVSNTNPVIIEAAHITRHTLLYKPTSELDRNNDYCGQEWSERSV